MTDPVIDPSLMGVIRGLEWCRDPRSGSRVFTGTIRIEFREHSVHLQAEDPNWETEEGFVVPTAVFRVEPHSTATTQTADIDVSSLQD